jgi:tetratricopeptide (TPR) repeat protein
MSRRRPLSFALLAFALFAASAAFARGLRIDADKPYDIAFVPSPRSLRWISLGHPTLAANLLWLQAVQYTGDPKADARGWDRLRPLVDVVTDLDPRHGYAYQTTGNILASAGRLEDSNAILEKGTRNVRDRYILPFHRAVNAFLYLGDYADAGRWFEIAARTPGAPPHLREYVLAMYVKGDTAEAAVSFLQKMRDEAQDEESRKALDHQIKRAILERDAARIEEAAAEWRARHGGVGAVVLESLVAEGLLPRVPPDPFGGVYYFDADGRVRSTVFPKRYDRPISGAQRDRELQESRARVNAVVESHLESNR